MTQISQNFDHFFINYKVERLQEETETRTQGAEIFIVTPVRILVFLVKN